jgi:hypothetical protein
MYIQIKAKIVTVGKAATKAPNLSLRFATSEIKTTTAAVVRYFMTIQSIRGLLAQNERIF